MPRKPTSRLSVTLSRELHDASQELAQEMGISLSSLVSQSLAAALRAKQNDEELQHSFDLLGDDPDSEVEFAVSAQREVLLDDDDSPR